MPTKQLRWRSRVCKKCGEVFSSETRQRKVCNNCKNENKETFSKNRLGVSRRELLEERNNKLKKLKEYLDGKSI